MDSVLAIRGKFVGFYKNYERWFQIAFKFVLAFMVFSRITAGTGFMPALDSTVVKIFLSLICSIASSSLFVLIAAVVLLVELYNLSMIMAAFAMIFMIILYCMFLKFAPKQDVLLLAVPVLLPLNLHYLLVFVAGMFFTPYAAIPVAIGFVVTRMTRYIIAAEAASLATEMFDLEQLPVDYKFIIDSLMGDKEMLMYIVVFAIGIAVVYLINRCSFDYAWYISIGAGAVVLIIGSFIVGATVGAQFNALSMIVGVIVSTVIAVIIQFFKGVADYAGKEYVQFEDDQYYYYVKAIPKALASVNADKDEALLYRFGEKVESQSAVKDEFQPEIQPEEELFYSESQVLDFGPELSDETKMAVPAKDNISDETQTVSINQEELERQLDSLKSFQDPK